MRFCSVVPHATPMSNADCWYRNTSGAASLPDRGEHHDWTIGSRRSEHADGFSFAYLKVLFLSATMRWIATPQPGAMDRVMAEQVAVLREQMASIEDLPSDPGYAIQDGPAMHPAHVYHRGPGPMLHMPGPQDIPR